MGQKHPLKLVLEITCLPRRQQPADLLWCSCLCCPLNMPIHRRPKGSPGGGQFAPSGRPEDQTNVSPNLSLDTDIVDATCIDCGAIYQTLTINGIDPAELSILRCAECET